MNFRKYVVFDFETDGKDPNTCNPVQVAACIVDPVKLERIPNEEFCMNMKPPGCDKPEYLTVDVNETLQFHVKHRTDGKGAQEILDEWKTYPDPKFVWGQFSNFVNQFNRKKNKWEAPIPVGANVRFDLTIAERLNNQYGISYMFWERDTLDTMNLSFLWLQWIKEDPRRYNMDTLREFFGIPLEGGHDALKDVRDTADILCRYLKLHKKIAQQVGDNFHKAFIKKSKNVQSGT